MALAVFAAVSLGFGAVFLPTLPHVLAVTTFGWSLFFSALYRRGCAPLGAAAAGLFWLLVAAERLNYGAVYGKNAIAYMGLIMAAFAAVAILHLRLRRRLGPIPLLLALAISLVLLATGFLYVWHNLALGTPVTPDVTYAIYQTNLLEAAEFLTEFVEFRYLMAAAAAMLLIGVLVYTQQTVVARRGRPVELAVFFVVALGAFTYYRSDVRVLQHVATSAAAYREELSVFRELRDRRSAGLVSVPASKRDSGETYIIVIGESLNRNHMQLYGYHRSTTPLLDSLHRSGEVLKFGNAYSTHPHTIPSLPYALTAANQRNGVRFLEAPSVIDVARAAGFETHWITNQLLYGAWDNAVSILAHGAERLVALNRHVGETTATTRYDDATVEVLRGVLRAKTQRNRLIVVHLMGSHAAYCKRFPPAFRRYAGGLPPGEFGRPRAKKIMERVNCYDNSVLYNDYVIAGLLGAAQRTGGVAGFVYFADHGQDVLGGRGHNAAQFSYPMIEIPMLAWFSGEYRSRYPDRVAALQNRRTEVFPTDFFFDTALGIAGIETPYYDPRADLSGDSYRTDDIELRLLHGSRRFLEPENAGQHQRRNIARLGELELLSRIVPHRVNSTGMLAQVLYDGFRSLEMDVRYAEGGGNGGFIIGHDRQHDSGNSLESVLALMPTDSMEKIWLDLKNLDARNRERVRARLLELDTRFGLKDKVIVESPEAAQLVTIGRNGFHTSYYLPTDLLLGLIQRNVRDRLQSEAHRISGQVTAADLQAVSFDHRLYDFVKQYLEPLISADVVYHTWELDLSLTDPEFLGKLSRSRRFRDARVKTILVKYSSDFSL